MSGISRYGAQVAINNATREADREIERLRAELDDKDAYLRTLAGFGGTLQQARELAGQALDKWQ